MIEVCGMYLDIGVLDVLENVKRQFDVNFRIKNSKEYVMITCQFHGEGQENTPSCKINKNNIQKHNIELGGGYFYCFACGRKGPMEVLISKFMGKNDAGKAGIKWLFSNYRITEEVKRPQLQLFTPTPLYDVKDRIEEEDLNKYKVKHKYMYERGLTDEIIERFNVGYDAENSCITVPIRNIMGDAVFIFRRSVLGKHFFYEKYDKKSHHIFGLYEGLDYIGEKQFYICESVLDALTVWKWGEVGLALLGASISEQQIDRLQRYAERKFFLALDNDEAGNLGREKLYKNLNKILIHLIIPPNKKDINEMTKEEWDNRRYVLAGL